QFMRASVHIVPRRVQIVRHGGSVRIGVVAMRIVIVIVRAMRTAGPFGRLNAAQLAAKEEHHYRAERRQQRNYPDVFQKEHCFSFSKLLRSLVLLTSYESQAQSRPSTNERNHQRASGKFSQWSALSQLEQHLCDIAQVQLQPLSKLD
ncbi:MAG: hypothetical protein ABR866_19675, partial [Candidatus Korobacteraceae bacterium]